jgi:acetyl-CoA synthetase
MVGMATSVEHERRASSGHSDPTTLWDAAWNEIGGPPVDGRGVNIADRVIDRHVRAGRGEHVALRWFGRDDVDAQHPVDITYQMLSTRTNRFASALRRRGFSPGSGVATLAGRLPELYVAALGTLKAECVYTPLFSAFGPDPIAQRLAIGGVKVLVTTPVHFRRKVVQILDRLPELELILIAGATEDSIADVPRGSTTGSVAVVSFGAFVGEGRDVVDEPTTSPDTPALLHFTSGTTGAPKRAVHVHEAVVAHAATAAAVLDVRPDDIYWCTSDPGWVTGTSYGIIRHLREGQR